MASTKRQVNKGTSDPSAQLADVAVYVDGGGNDVAASAVAYVDTDNTTPRQVTPATPLPIEETKGAAITGTSIPAGGVGLIGWLSAIWKAITDRLPAALVGGRLDVNVGNTITNNMLRATTPTVSAVSASASSVQIVTANASRLGLSIYNDSAYSLYLRYGSGAASTSDYSVLMPAGALYEVPDRSTTLEIRGIWTSASGNARVTETS